MATLTAEQFDAIAQLLRMLPGSTRRELARLVLVEGLTQADAARRLDTTHQAASNAVRAVSAGLELARRAVG